MVDGKIVYTKDSLKYYNSYGISKEMLYNDKIFCVSNYTFSRVIKGERENSVVKPFPEICMVLELQNQRAKIYYPLRKEFKWFSNTTISNYWYNHKDNKDIIILCTSHKDGRVVYNTLGCGTFAPISETCSYTKEQIELIKSYNKIFTLGDGDLAGEKFNKSNIEIFGAIPINIQEYNCYTNSYGKKTKDISEIYRLDKELCFNILSNGISMD